MTDDCKNTRPWHTRPWQEIAAEAAREKDPKKLIALTNELEVALDERDKALRAKRAES